MSDDARLEENLREYLARLTERAGARRSAEASVAANLSSRRWRVSRQLMVLAGGVAMFTVLLAAGLAIRAAVDRGHPPAPAPAASAPVQTMAPSAPASPTPPAAVVCPRISSPATPAAGPMPSPRGEAAMAADPRDCSVLLFGGSKVDGHTVLGDTWRWVAGVWTELHPSPAPPPRVFGALAFDPATSQMVLWGGGAANTGDPYHGDTWTWDGAVWTQRKPATSPSPGSGTMAYDSGAARLLLVTQHETWAWDGATWLRLGTAPMVVDPLGAFLVSNPTDGATYLFTTVTPDPALPSRLQVFRWASGTWVDATPAAASPPCIEGAAAEPGQAIVVMGCEGSQWRYSVSTAAPPVWQLVTHHTTTGQRRGINMVQAPDGRTVLLFGGISNDTTGLLHNDLWAWDGASWSRLTADSPVPSH